MDRPHKGQFVRQRRIKRAKIQPLIGVFYRIQFADNRHPDPVADQFAGGGELPHLDKGLQLHLLVLKAPGKLLKERAVFARMNEAFLRKIRWPYPFERAQRMTNGKDANRSHLDIGVLYCRMSKESIRDPLEYGFVRGGACHNANGMC